MSLCALLAQPIPFVRESSYIPSHFHTFQCLEAPLPDLKTEAHDFNQKQQHLPSSSPNSNFRGKTISQSKSALPSASPLARKRLRPQPAGLESVESPQKKLRFNNNNTSSENITPRFHCLTRLSNSEQTHSVSRGRENASQSSLEAPEKLPFIVRGRGYLNRSGTHCYRNASLQALGCVLEFRNLVLNHSCESPKKCICCHLRTVFREHYRSHGILLSPHEPSQLRVISQFIGGSFARTKFSRQEDAHEYIALLLDRLSTHTSRNVKTSINKIFTSTKVTEIICMNQNCRNVLKTRTMEDTLIILNMPNRTQKRHELSLDDCLRQYTKSERVVDYRCEKCGKLGIEKKLVFESPPSIALIALSRFKFGWAEGRGKDKRRVTYPEYLFWEAYTEGQTGRSRLLAIICHESSSLDSGHYYAIVRSGRGGWLKYDDEEVIKVKNPLEGLEQKWYMLLYESRRDYIN